MSAPESSHHAFPWRITALVVLVVAAATAVAWLLLARDRVEPPPPAATAQPSSSAATALPVVDDRQLTVLLTVRDDAGSAVSTVLFGVGGGTGYTAELMLPRDLLLPAVPPVRLGDADDPTGPSTAEQPLETLLGVRIDGLVDLDRLAWSGLIDATGSRVSLPAAQAPGSFALVVDRVLEGLPYDSETVGELLTGLGSMARTTVTTEDAGLLLSRVGRGLRTGDVRRETLPVTYLRSGSDRVAVADLEATDGIVRELFPEALLEPGHDGQPRLVLTGSGATLGAVTQARLTLTGAGFGVVVDPAEGELAARSQVLVPAESPAAQALGLQAATALGLPESSVAVDAGPTPTVDVRVLLGPAAAGS